MKKYLSLLLLPFVLLACSRKETMDVKVVGIVGPISHEGGWHVTITTDRGDMRVNHAWKTDALDELETWHVGSRYTVELRDGVVVDVKPITP